VGTLGQEFVALRIGESLFVGDPVVAVAENFKVLLDFVK
jgi:hypothetical protein